MERHYLHSLAPGYDRDVVLADLMRTYGEDVWNFAFFITRKPDAADDISQDVFLAAYNRLYSFRGECTVKSWLLTITRNKSLNYGKRAFFRKVTLRATILHRGHANSAERVAFDRLDTIELWKQVMALPAKYREVLILTYHYELAMKEIAHMLRISEGTVKSRLFRAKAQLADAISNGEAGD